jgi:vancomycin resistance protein YoaR
MTDPLIDPAPEPVPAAADEVPLHTDDPPDDDAAEVPDGPPEPVVAESATDPAADDGSTDETEAADADRQEERAAAVAAPPAADDRRPESPPRRGHPRLRAIGVFAIAFAAVCLVGSTIGAAAIYAHQTITDGLVPIGVRVDGVDVSGLTPDEATARIDLAFARMGEGTIILDGEGVRRVLSFADVGRRVDSAAAVDRAMQVASQGTIVDRALASARTAIDGVAIEATPTLDAALLVTAIDRAVVSFERPAIDATITTTPDGIVTTPSRTGRSVDREIVVERALEALSRADAPATVTIPITTLSQAPALTEADVQAAARAVDAMATDVILRHGDETWKIPAKSVRPWILATTADGEIRYDIDRSLVEAQLTKLRAKTDQKPRNASFLTAKGGRVVGVRASKNGRAVDVPATTEAIARTVLGRASGAATGEARAVMAVVQPKLSTAEAEKTAPLMKKISSHTTWFPYGERNFYGANIWIPGRIVNGTVLAPGEKFDFWRVVGYPSRSRGFGMGGAIINGKTEPTGALAGGICSTSTTLFNAAAKAGLKTGARRNHYYYIDRYPLGLDATVVYGGQNMTFTNDTKYPILIVNRNWRSGSRGYIRFEMWSVPNGRTVRFTKPVVKNIQRAWTVVKETTALPPGATRVEESEHDGMDVWRTRIVTDSRGKVIHKDTYYSHYGRVNGLILKGVADTTS